MRQETSAGRNDVASRELLDRLGVQVRHQMSGCLRDFHLNPRGNGLVLRGRTRTYYAKQLAQNAVMRATDLPIVSNEIEVF
jgi:hypothetical protein